MLIQAVPCLVVVSTCRSVTNQHMFPRHIRVLTGSQSSASMSNSMLCPLLRRWCMSLLVVHTLLQHPVHEAFKPNWRLWVSAHTALSAQIWYYSTCAFQLTSSSGGVLCQPPLYTLHLCCCSNRLHWRADFPSASCDCLSFSIAVQTQTGGHRNQMKSWEKSQMCKASDCQHLRS